MRGISHFLDVCHCLFRATSADAGNMDSSTYRKTVRWKHPRRRGEYVQTTGAATVEKETPPQMRGILFHLGEGRLWKRNTPADAGNIISDPSLQSAIKKHPRGCGEYWSIPCTKWSTPETPPLMRGISEKPFDILRLGRNTPADAGNIQLHDDFDNQHEKHPR